MNDSFLEDLELAPVKREAGNTLSHAERHITRRSPKSSSCPDHEDLNFLIAKQGAKQNVKLKVPTQPTTKLSRRKSDESPRVATKDAKILEIQRTRMLERRSKATENKLKPVENMANIEAPISKNQPKDHSRRSGESSRNSDGSSKENSRPSDSSHESVLQPETNGARMKNLSDGVSRRKESTEKFEVAMLNSVKEIVATYTKNESAKILRAIQDSYINSQANFIKLILEQTDEIVDEVGAKKDSPRLRSLLEENARLRENIAVLEARNEEFKKTVEESERMRQENLQLKQHCEELLKSVNSKVSYPDAKKNEEKRRPSSLSRDESSNMGARKLLQMYKNSK